MKKDIIEATKNARREYHKEWRAKNKDKVREYNRRFWEKRGAALIATQKIGSNDDESNHDESDN